MTTSWRAVWLLMLGACGSEHGQSPSDAPPASIDAIDSRCSSGPSARVTGSAGTYDRVYAGAVSLPGPVAGPGLASMQLHVVFANAAALDPNILECCVRDSSCCAIDTLAATTEPILPGAEAGSHQVTFTKTFGSDLAVPGTLTITTFVDPFASQPGMLGGTIQAATNGQTIDGDFATEFCPALLSIAMARTSAP